MTVPRTRNYSNPVPAYYSRKPHIMAHEFETRWRRFETDMHEYDLRMFAGPAVRLLGLV